MDGAPVSQRRGPMLGQLTTRQPHLEARLWFWHKCICVDSTEMPVSLLLSLWEESWSPGSLMPSTRSLSGGASSALGVSQFKLVPSGSSPQACPVRVVPSESSPQAYPLRPVPSGSSPQNCPLRVIPSSPSSGPEPPTAARERCRGDPALRAILMVDGTSEERGLQERKWWGSPLAVSL